MEVNSVNTHPFDDQRPGTSGLRKPTKKFQQKHYLENFIQSIFDVLRAEDASDFSKQILVIGGDGRYYNQQAIQIIIKLAAGNGIGKLLIGQNGILSTPAASALIRRSGALGGIILSASHNPGGPDGDFGVKYNIHNGGPAPSKYTEAFFERSRTLDVYHLYVADDVNLSLCASSQIGNTQIEVIDSVAVYADLMSEIFDFAMIRAWFESGKSLLFDGMHAVTGPYAKEIFENRLGAASGCVINGEPLEDFGNGHPDPNLVYAKELVERMNRGEADLGAASDGDGDRNMILGPGSFVSPGDSLAIIAEHLQFCVPGYKEGLRGVARSMPTSTAVDRVAADLGIACHETPTGWKYFGNLMDADLCTICGEESFGTSSSHIREKDGIWAVLCWLSILAKHHVSVKDIMLEHWKKFGRSFFQRYDFEGLDKGKAADMFEAFRGKLKDMPGQMIGGVLVEAADEFSYVDPVDHSRAEKQGIRLLLQNRARIIVRFSGTGTQGATLRLYLEFFDQENYEREADSVLKKFADEMILLLRLKEFCNISQPTVVT